MEPLPVVWADATPKQSNNVAADNPNVRIFLIPPTSYVQDHEVSLGSFHLMVPDRPQDAWNRQLPTCSGAA